METTQKKRFIKRYTLKDIKDFLDSVGYEWCSMQVKDMKTGKCSNGNIKMFNGNTVLMYLRFKSMSKPSFHYVTVTNSDFIVQGQGYSINMSEYWKPFYKSNQKKEELVR